MADDFTCLRCGGALEEGYIPESSGHGLYVSYWVEGRPEKSFWNGLKTGRRRLLKTFTYRCVECGRLESFAREAVE